ncbi:MAG: cell division protein FtsA [Candidatus Roizmanbacteria bacterium]|nr:MAG: cell division protein FtsA [Candidatus Roizmanbacteria bacterium]
MADKLICGVDIGSSKIATVVGIDSPDHDELRIIGFNSTPSRGVKKGLVVDIDQVTTSIEESVEKAERMAGHKITHAFASVGGPHISSLNSHGVVAVSNPQGEITEDDVVRAVDAAKAISLSTTRQIIEISPRDYSVDGQSGIKNPVGMSGVRLEVDTHLITASTTNLKNIDRCLSDLGITNAGFIFSGLASAEAVLTDTEKDLGVVLVDIGGGKTDLCIYIDGSLSYSASIPIGAKHITNDIAVGLRVSLASAELIKIFLSKHLNANKLKNKTGDLPNLKELNITEDISDISVKNVIEEIANPRIEEIYKFIGEEIEKSDFAKNIPSGLVITGGGALTVGMVEAGRKIIGLPIRLGIPEKVSGLVDEIIDTQFSSTIGLIFYGKKHALSETKKNKDFNKIFKDFSINKSFSKFKDLFKQFLP